MPNARFYMRNNSPMPDLDAATFRLGIAGLVERSQSFTIRDLQNMRSKTHVVTLECAGNGLALFDPPAEGEKWGLGAVSTAEWTGVPLVEILDRAGVRPEAKEVLLRRRSRGRRVVRRRSASSSRDRRRARQRRAPGLRDERRAAACRARVAAPHRHAGYAVASVKWLTEIELIDRAFTGHYQGDKHDTNGSATVESSASRSRCSGSAP